jgi:hypothetical protein
VTGAVSRNVAALGMVLLAASGLLAVRTVQRGEAELVASERAFDAGQVELALGHARRAAAAYVPGARHVDAAYERLRAIARGAELARDTELARVAWSAVRGAAWESQHIWQPRAAELREADAQLARLAGPRPAGVRPDEGVGPRRGFGFVLALAGGAAAGVLGLWWLLARERSWSSGAPGVRLAAVSCLVGALAWGWALLQL